MDLLMHSECLSPEALKLARGLGQLVRRRDFILAGGTALALQIGHRRSIDLDFFTHSVFSTEALITDLKQYKSMYKVLLEEKDSLLLTIDGVKVSFFRDAYSLREPDRFFEGIPLARIEDISAMKVLAIVQRGAKRDFVDVFFALRKMPFHVVAERIVERYGPERVNPINMGKSLVYFADAEVDPDPAYLPGFETEWGTVRTFFNTHVKQFVLDLKEAGPHPSGLCSRS